MMKISLPALQHPKYLGSENDIRLQTYFQRQKDIHHNDSLEEEKRRLYDVNALGMEVRGERRAILSKISKKVETAMKNIDNDLKARQKRLKELLDKEHEEQTIELMMISEKTARAEKDNNTMDKIQRELEINQQSGLVCVDKETKLPGLRKMSGREALKELQKVHILQMQDRENIQQQDYEREKMWHEIMLQQHQQMQARNEEDALAMQHLRDTTKRELTKQIIDTQINRRNQENRVKNELNMRFKDIDDRIEAKNKSELQQRLTHQSQWRDYFKQEITARGLAKKAEKYPHPMDLARIETANRDQREYEKWQVIKKNRIAMQEEMFLQHQTNERMRQKILEDEAEKFSQQCHRQKQQKNDEEERLFNAYNAKMKQKSIAVLQKQLSERDKALHASQLARLSAAEEARRSAHRSRQEVYEKKVKDMMNKNAYAKDLQNQIEQECHRRRHKHILEG